MNDFDLDDILNEIQETDPSAPAKEEAAPSPSRRPERREPAYREEPESAYPDSGEPEPEDEAGLGEPERWDAPAPRRSSGPRLQAPDFGPLLQKAGKGLRSGLGKAREGGGKLLADLNRYRKERQSGQRQAPDWLPRAVTIGLLILSLLCASWILHNVHPGSGTTVRGKPGANLASRIAPDEVVTEDPVLGILTPVKTHYVIERDAVVAPAPNPACFGTISIEEPEKVLEVIQKARDYGLLGEDETVAFDPNVSFYYDEQIEYYLDETILVICWKEVIDGNTCSFVEIKIADASQFRRKFADDTFASASQYYSTEMHKSTNAVVTLNADFYQNRDFGVVVYNSTLYRFPTSTYTGSYKKYNCLETCYVNDEGDFLFTELGQVFTQEELERYIEDNHILFSISFGPVLVRDGEVRECDWYPVGEINRGYSRAGIGQVDKLHYLYMSLNHSPEKEARWTVNEFAQHFGEKPVKNAYCLDGGQTGEIVFQGRAYNHVDVVNGQKERPVSDNIYFATAIGGTEVSR